MFNHLNVVVVTDIEVLADLAEELAEFFDSEACTARKRPLDDD